jgi:putative nucleotidyltransferase with HDIG domain
LEAPGTYQHCLVAGNLAEAAAHSIGANGLFCRVSTLYHDVGKLFNPHYFTENQLGGFNIHQLLTPRESAQVIMSHVTEGEVLGRKYRLPPSFLSIIREHHGTSLIFYFYYKQVEQAGGDASLVDERHFRYKGPKPHTRESAIIMLSDSVEATTRSLDEYTEESIASTVHRIFKEKIDEGQLDECRLTFEELSTIKQTMIKALFVAHHMRIKYPAKRNEVSPHQIT